MGEPDAEYDSGRTDPRLEVGGCAPVGRVMCAVALEPESSFPLDWANKRRTTPEGIEMADADRERLIAFERVADAKIQEIGIGLLPARAVWALLHVMIFRLLNREGLTSVEARVTGDTLATRLSYILPWLKARSTLPLGESTQDAILATMEVPAGRADLNDLLAYAHFSELMPDVHRRLLDVNCEQDGAFRLGYNNTEEALAEAKDILVSELALNHLRDTVRQRPDEEAFELARTAPRMDFSTLRRLARRRSDYYRQKLVEHPLVTEVGMQAIFGFDLSTYREVQAAVLGFSDVVLQVAMILSVWSEADGGEPSKEALEWTSVFWREPTLSQTIASISGVAREHVSRFINAFTLDYDEQKGPPIVGGEGFTPPFVRLENALLFSADLIQRFCHVRNAIVSMDKREDQRFDEFVSGGLEPVLLAEVRAELERLDGVLIVTNSVFPGGELDLVAVDTNTDFVVVVEAKAPVPPQGSRATTRLAGRMREGVRQIQRFRNLPKEIQCEHLRRATGLPLQEPVIDFWLLGRSCFGAREVWSPASAVRPVTLPLLRLALRRKRCDAEALAGLGASITLLVDEMLNDVNWRWEHARVEMFGQILLTPQLLYDRTAVARWTREAGGGDPPEQKGPFSEL